MRIRRDFFFTFALPVALLMCSCNLGVLLEHLDHTESVCQDIGFCTTASSDEIKACEEQAATLRTEASGSGCVGLFDDYYACADDHYECDGNVPTFRGCETKLSALRDCLARGEATNSCGALNAALTACGGASNDGGIGGAADAGPTDTPPPPCVDGSVCVARCYLDNVPDVCSPIPIQLTAAIQCAQQCQF